MPDTSPPSGVLVNTVVCWAYILLLAFKGVVVLIVWADWNSAGSVEKKALSSASVLALALSASGITLSKTSGDMSVCCTCACSSTI